MNEQQQKQFDDLGFVTGFNLTPAELGIVRSIIRQEYQQRLETVIKPKNIPDIEQYHTLKDLDHSELWDKRTRTLPRHRAEEILSIGYFKKLFKTLHVEQVADIEGWGDFDEETKQYLPLPEMTWRIVRPNHVEDCPMLHTDGIYMKQFGQENYPLNKCLKLWIPVYAEAGMSGLVVVPWSQKRNHIWRTGKYHDRIQPVLAIEPPFTELLNQKPGEAVLFGMNLLHTGACGGDKTRISLEMTLVQ